MRIASSSVERRAGSDARRRSGAPAETFAAFLQDQGVVDDRLVEAFGRVLADEQTEPGNEAG
ncbi:MAG: hypothetical protein R2705_17265 [Ilumatobacteraceae bacterium]